MNHGISSPALSSVWIYGQRFCCEQLFRDQKSGIFQLESSCLRDPERLNRLLLVLSIGVLIGSLQGFAVSLSGQRNQVDAHWERCLSFLRIGLSWMQQCVADSSKTLLAWAPIPLRKREPCIPSQSSQQNQRLPWFSKVDLPPPLDCSVPALVSQASQARSVGQSGCPSVVQALEIRCATGELGDCPVAAGHAEGGNDHFRRGRYGFQHGRKTALPSSTHAGSSGKAPATVFESGPA